MVDWGGLILADLLVELMPGPNMAWLVAVTLRSGRKAGLLAILGVAVGMAINGAAATGALLAFEAVQPKQLLWLRYAGALVMVVLAIDAWRAADRIASEGTPGQGSLHSFRAGLVTNVLNAKAAMFVIFVAPQFSGGAILSGTVAAGFVGIVVAVATLVHASLVALASFLGVWIRHRTSMRRLSRVLAICMLAIALWIAMHG